MFSQKQIVSFLKQMGCILEVLAHKHMEKVLESYVHYNCYLYYLDLPFLLNLPLHVEFKEEIKIEAFKAWSSIVELQFIFCSWINKKLWSLSRESASMSLDSSVEQTT